MRSGYLIFLLLFVKYSATCDTSQFNNFHLKWFSGLIDKGNEAYAENGLEDFKNVSSVPFISCRLTVNELAIIFRF